jgi:hypothetical protein
MREIMLHLSFYSWLISFNIMISRSVQVVPDDKFYPFYNCVVFYCVYILHFLPPYPDLMISFKSPLHSLDKLYLIMEHINAFNVLAVVFNLLVLFC